MVAQIGFDARMVQSSGIGTHIRGLMQAFAELPEPGLGFHFLGDAQELSRLLYFRSLGQIHHCPLPIYGLSEQLSFPQLPGISVWHFPHYNVPRRLQQPFFVTVHDLIHLLFPEVLGSRLRWWYARSLMRHAVRKAVAVFTVSHCSRNDLIRELRVPEEKIVLVPNAVSGNWRTLPETELLKAKSELRLPDRYLLAVSNNKRHKNMDFLARAFLDWGSRTEHGVQLVICGFRESERGAFAARWNLQLENGATDGNMPIRLMEHVTTDQFPAVYQCADALVVPSLYEGFGFPVLEAQALGTPVIASNAGPLTEVAGDAALFFDPRSPAELTARLDELYGSESVRTRLAQAGQLNCRRYRWQDAAQITLNRYREYLG